MIFSIFRKNNTKLKSQILNSKSVSVIICAKNEAENLQKNLPLLLNQNYPNFEVIVVDDGSDDETSSIINGLKLRNNNLKLITISKDEKIGLGKKYALQKGIEDAKNELILLTDADCQPLSKNWISVMAACITDKYKIVLGISPYKKENSLLNILIEYETAQTALQYIGFALMGNPYMSVGRNVMYNAALLKSKVWTAKELAIASGDDDLAIQSLATNENTTVCLSKDSYTISEAKKTWNEWLRQKLRHYESGHQYAILDRFILGAYLVSKILLYTVPLMLLLFFNVEISIILSAIIFYIIAISLINLILQLILNLNKRWFFAVITDITYGITTMFLGFISLIKPANKWK